MDHIPVATPVIQRCLSQLQTIYEATQVIPAFHSHEIIAIESPDILSDCDREDFVDMWNR